MTHLVALHVANAALAVGVLVALLAALRTVSLSPKTIVARLVLRTRDTMRAMAWLVAAVVLFVASHLVDLFALSSGVEWVQSAHEVLQTLSLGLIFVCLYSLRVVALGKPRVRGITMLPEESP